jgi:hypothetical protein
MRGHKGPVKAYVQRDREGSTHIYSLLISVPVLYEYYADGHPAVGLSKESF